MCFLIGTEKHGNVASVKHVYLRGLMRNGHVQRIFQAGHDGKQKDLVPCLRVAVIVEHRRIVAVQDVEHAKRQAVGERMTAGLTVRPDGSRKRRPVRERR